VVEIRENCRKKNQKGVLETRCGCASSWSSAGVPVEMESDHLGFYGVGNVLGKTVANKKFSRDDGDFKKLVPDFCNSYIFSLDYLISTVVLDAAFLAIPSIKCFQISNRPCR
jgi:hypothetical protein